jgi:hypothetical protein
MNNVLSWLDALTYFGPALDSHRDRLSKAGQTTHGLLACRWAPGEAVRMASQDGDHAERRLVLSPLWKEIDAALSRWDLRDDPMLILLALNRSPCADCAAVLAGALHALEHRYALRCERQHFVLASLGYYQGAGFMSTGGAPHLLKARSRNVTTSTGLDALKHAGWKLCVLDFGTGLTRRGAELLEFLKHLG